MKHQGLIGLCAAMIAVTASGQTAHAGAIERSGQSVQVLFEDGNYAELGWIFANPEVTGTDLLGAPTGNVGPRFDFGSLGIKVDASERLSFGFLIDQPYGTSVRYGAGSAILGGTLAEFDSTAYTALLRYRVNESWSVHGGPKAQRVSASATLAGAGFGPLDGYGVKMDKSWGYGYVLGMAYEIPDIAARVALTYNSEVSYDVRTQEAVPVGIGGPATVPGDASFKTPQSVNLDVQTGIAARTLLFGQVRWVDWSRFNLAPAVFSAAAGEPLVSYPQDIFTYTVGIGHQISDRWSVAVQAAYEDEGNRAGSLLGPVNGYTSLGIGASYETDRIRVSLGLAEYWLRDTDPVVGSTTVANFSDNRATIVELRVGFHF